MRRAIEFMLTLLVALAAPALASDPRLAPALQALDEFRLDDAQRLLEGLHDVASSPDYLYLQARIEAANYRADNARRLAEACIGQYPDASRCYEVAGDAWAILLAQESNNFTQLKYARRAKRAWAHAVELDPRNMRARLMLMRYYQMAPMILGGSKRAARRERDAIIATFPHREQFARGMYSFQDGDWDDAIKHLRAAVATDGEHAESRYYLALAYMERGEVSPGIEELTTLVDESPQFWEAWFNLGVKLIETGIDSRLGLRALYTFVKGAPAAGAKRLANAYYFIGRQLEREGDTDAAREAYAAALRAKPGHNESGEAYARLTAGSSDS